MKKKLPHERPYERFVREYMDGYTAGEGIKEIAARLETTKATVGVYAAVLRRNGVSLPKITDRFDAGFLNKIIHSKKKKKVKTWAG